MGTTAVHHSPLVSAAVQTPLVYNSPVVNTVYKTAAVSTGVHQPIVYNSAVQSPLTYHTYGKRDAEAEPEADPALVYTTNTLPLTTAVHQPLVYNSAVQTPLVYKTPVLSNVFPSLKTLPTQPIVYNTAVHTPLLKTVDNAVVPAVGGYIHSSHVGVCTNNLGIRVPC